MTDKEREQKMKKFEGVAKDILNLSRDSLIVNMRFIDSAISRLTLTPGETGSTSTNGEKYFFDKLRISLSCLLTSSVITESTFSPFILSSHVHRNISR